MSDKTDWEALVRETTLTYSDGLHRPLAAHAAILYADRVVRAAEKVVRLNELAVFECEEFIAINELRIALSGESKQE